jgi:Zn-dependent M28 family amino/carboxypeptidase
MALLFPEGSWHLYIMLLFVLLTPALVTYYDMHGDEPVDGACDNLSGVAIAYDTFRSFADANARGKSILKNTRIKFVSFGSEETGLTGSFKYAELKADELHKENAHIINIDSIRTPEEVCIITGETMNGTKYSKLLIDRVEKGFSSLSIPVKKGATPIGGTDGVFFVRAGLPAVSLIGLSMGKLDPTYHTRRDVIENLNPLALENVKNGLAEFVRQWDGNS